MGAGAAGIGAGATSLAGVAGVGSAGGVAVRHAEALDGAAFFAAAGPGLARFFGVGLTRGFVALLAFSAGDLLVLVKCREKRRRHGVGEGWRCGKDGCGGRTRTGDSGVMSPALYQLSYTARL
jgi:hypothetical protein